MPPSARQQTVLATIITAEKAYLYGRKEKAIATETPLHARDAMPVPDFPPDPSGTERVAREIIGTLSMLPFIQRIAVFGSLAEEHTDCWSDVDLWVACDDVEHTQWIAASAIRAAHSVLFYRMFGNAAQPAGRYWFDHESPFHKIDISFHSCSDYQIIINQPLYFGYPVTVCEVYARKAPALSVDLPAPCYPVEISATERAIGMQVYYMLRAIKLYSRGEWERSIVEERYAALRAVMGSLNRSAVMGGGKIGELTYRVLDLAHACLRVHVNERGLTC